MTIKRYIMFELQWIVNESTNEHRLYYRQDILAVDASGAYCPSGEKTAWIRVPVKTLDEAAMDDVVESGGIFPHE